MFFLPLKANIKIIGLFGNGGVSGEKMRQNEFAIGKRQSHDKK